MFRSTLHDAMRSVLLRQKDHTASTSLISDEIAREGLYSRKDGAVARAQQINARARKYPKLFAFVDPHTIRLIGTSSAT